VTVPVSSFLSRSATAIQSSIRGFFGRKRLRAMRGIQQAAKLAMESADILKPRVLEELAALPVPPPAVASVVQCALILLAPLERLYTHAGHVFVDPEEAAKAKAASKIASQHIDSDSDSGDDANADTVRRSPPLLPPSLSVHGLVFWALMRARACDAVVTSIPVCLWDFQDSEDEKPTGEEVVSTRTITGQLKTSFILSNRHNQMFVNHLLPPVEQEQQANVSILAMSWDMVQQAIVQPLFAMRVRRMAMASTRSQLVVPLGRLEAIRVCAAPARRCFCCCFALLPLASLHALLLAFALFFLPFLPSFRRFSCPRCSRIPVLNPRASMSLPSRSDVDAVVDFVHEIARHGP
jgi:hypothetical protein